MGIKQQVELPVRGQGGVQTGKPSRRLWLGPRQAKGSLARVRHTLGASKRATAPRICPSCLRPLTLCCFPSSIFI